MRIVIGSPQPLRFSDTVSLLLHAGHRVTASVLFEQLLRKVQAEDPDVVILAGTGYAHLSALGRPVLIVDPESAPVPGATVVRDWPAACKTLQDWPLKGTPADGSSPSTVPAPPDAGQDTPTPLASERAAPAVAAPPQPASAGQSTPAFTPLWLYPVLGGVGASTLAATLAAAGAEAGFHSLALSADPVAFAARFGIALKVWNTIQAVTAHLHVARVKQRSWTPNQVYDLAVWDAGHSRVPESAGRVALLARPTGDGRLALVTAAAALAQPLHLILTGEGALEPAEVVARCGEYGVHFSSWTVLPHDPDVAVLNDTQGHALNSSRYGPAVQRLARQLWPDLAWPVEAGKDDSQANALKGNRAGLTSRLKSILELTD